MSCAVEMRQEPAAPLVSCVHLISTMSYDDIERLCAKDETLDCQVFGTLKDEMVRPLLEADDVESALNTFDEQFRDDIWQARLREDFGLHVMPQNEMFNCFVVVHWGGDTMKSIVDHHAKEFRKIICEMSHRFFPNDEKLAERLSSTFAGTYYGRLIAFHSLYRKLYMSPSRWVMTKEAPLRCSKPITHPETIMRSFTQCGWTRLRFWRITRLGPMSNKRFYATNNER